VLQRIAVEHGIIKLRVFGSSVQGPLTAPRDIDLLVVLAPGRDLVDLVAFKLEAERLLGRQVDVAEEEGLSPYLREKILAEAVPL